MGRFKTGAILGGHPAALKYLETYVTGKLPTDLPVELESPAGSYPMLGNDRYGDCTIAGMVHAIETWNTLTSEKDFVPDEKEAVARYLKLTGGVDSGLVISNLLHEWYTAGDFHEKIKGYAPASNPRDLLLLRQIIYVFGGVYLGIACPETAQEQFSNGEPWTYQGEQTNDGHCIWGCGWYANGDLRCKTWGGEARVTGSFIAHYFLEAYGVVGHQFVEKGSNGRGIDEAGLQQDLARL